MNMISTINGNEKTINGFGWLQRKPGEQFHGYAGLAEHLRERSEKAQTKVIENKGINLAAIDLLETKDDANRLGFIVDGNPIEFTHWSFGQLATLAKAPPAYLRTLPAAYVKDCLEYGLRFNREIEDVKPYFDGDELRAITGPGYGRVDDFEVVEAVMDILDQNRWVPAEGHMGLRATDRSLQMFMIDKENPVVVGKTQNGSDDIMYRGLRVSNSELGYSALAVDGFLFRSYCQNGCIFGIGDAQRITVRHSKGAPSRWAREVQPALEAYASEDGSLLVDHVKRLKEMRVAENDDKAVDFLNNRGLSRSQARAAIERVQEEENSHARTAWDMVQGITAIARDVKATEDRADIERIAGKIWQKAA